MVTSRQSLSIHPIIITIITMMDGIVNGFAKLKIVIYQSNIGYHPI